MKLLFCLLSFIFLSVPTSEGIVVDVPEIDAVVAESNEATAEEAVEIDYWRISCPGEECCGGLTACAVVTPPDGDEQ
jgi:hypothetical protein